MAPYRRHRQGARVPQHRADRRLARDRRGGRARGPRPPCRLSPGSYWTWTSVIGWEAAFALRVHRTRGPAVRRARRTASEDPGPTARGERRGARRGVCRAGLDPRHVGPGLPEPGASRPCIPRSRGGRDPLHPPTRKAPRAARARRLQLPTLAGIDRRLVAATAAVVPAPTTGRPHGRPNLKTRVSAHYAARR